MYTSTSYSCINDGNKSLEEIHNYSNDEINIYEEGYSKIKNGDLKEKFYKINNNKMSNSKKILLGKSKNKKCWDLHVEDSEIKQNKRKKYHEIQDNFYKKPSNKHRLEDALKRKTSNKNELNSDFISRFNKMNLDMNDFFENDFFYN